MKYILKMKNPRTGNVETYSTDVRDESERRESFEMFESVGYEIVSFEPVA